MISKASDYSTQQQDQDNVLINADVGTDAVAWEVVYFVHQYFSFSGVWETLLQGYLLKTS